MLIQSLIKVLSDNQVHILRNVVRNASNIGFEQFEHADINDLIKCRNEKEVYLVLVDEKMVNPCWDLPKIIIVGAGMAGLSAAHSLVSSGFTDVTVLEASDGPGGRVLSYDMRSFPVDLGATHIEGATSMNPIYNLACQEGLLQDSVYTSSPYLGSFMTSCGVILPPNIESAVHYSFDVMEKEAQNLFRTGQCTGDNLWDFFERKIEEECGSYPELYRGMVSRALYGRLNELRGYWGDDFEKFAADQYGAFVRLPGCNVRVPSGMIGTIAPLIKDMPEYSIVYCKPVQLIKWNEIAESQNDCVPVEKKEKSSKFGRKGKKEKEEVKEQPPENRPAKVICADGTEYTADYVIVTCSLGYLKKHHSSLFFPKLPVDKELAIKRLGWGNLTNIYLLYNEPFWVWKEGLIRLAWSRDELKTKNMWLKGIGSITEVLSSCQMLMVRVAGDEAIEAETLTIPQISDDLTRLIRCFIGDQTLPYPFHILQSKWHHNEYILGSKAYIAKGSNIGDICNLAAPMPGDAGSPPVVLFAGEATHPKYFGTLHGARLSGIREAQRITKLTHSFQGKPSYECKPPACTGEIEIECLN